MKRPKRVHGWPAASCRSREKALAFISPACPALVRVWERGMRECTRVAIRNRYNRIPCASDFTISSITVAHRRAFQSSHCNPLSFRAPASSAHNPAYLPPLYQTRLLHHRLAELIISSVCSRDIAAYFKRCFRQRPLLYKTRRPTSELNSIALFNLVEYCPVGSLSRSTHGPYCCCKHPTRQHTLLGRCIIADSRFLEADLNPSSTT